MSHFPRSVQLAVAGCHAHPGRLFLAIIHAAAADQAVAEADGIIRNNLRIMNLENHLARRAHGEACLPVLSVGIRALELQLRDGIEGTHIGSIVGHDPIGIEGENGFQPGVHLLPNSGFAGRADMSRSHDFSPFQREV